jgi:hypothetical protein
MTQQPTRPHTAQQETGTVTQVSPLKVKLDLELSDGPARALDGKTYALNDRVAVLVRRKQLPLVLGVES